MEFRKTFESLTTTIKRLDVLQFFGVPEKPRMTEFKSSSSQNRLFLGSKQQRKLKFGNGI